MEVLASHNNRSHIICKFWAVGECVKGDQCPFSHAWPTDGFSNLAQLQTPRKICSQKNLVIRPVVWNPPWSDWIKINTDGAAHGCPGEAGCGGVFRDSGGVVLGAFSAYLGTQTALEAEMNGVIRAIHIAWTRGWHNIWLECDSTLTLCMLKNAKHDVPLSNKQDWYATLEKISLMDVMISHIYREGNVVADKLANHGLRSRTLENWWNQAPDFIVEDSLKDAVGHIRYRVKS